MNVEKLNEALAALDDAIESIVEADDYLVDLYSDDEVSAGANLAIGRRLDSLADAVRLVKATHRRIELFRD